jgi:DNA-binding transcriptional MerR regulator
MTVAALGEVSAPSLIPIGRFAHVTGISVSALRFYDGHSLLRPVAVDPQSGYRYYGLEQLDTAVTLRLLRDLDVPLSEIKELLRAGRAEIGRVLETHRDRMVERQRGIGEVVARIDRLLDREPSALAPEIRLVDVPAMSVISRRTKRARPGLDPTIVVFSDGLHDSLPNLGPPPDVREVVLHHDLLRQYEIIDFEVCVPLPAGAQMPGSWDLPGGRAARTVHYGAWSEIWSTYAALLSWIACEQHATCGPLREVYLVDERDVSEPREYVTELTWLIT